MPDSDFAPDAFIFWFNVQQSRDNDGSHWASSEISLEEIDKLHAWAHKQEPIENYKGEPSVSLQANLRPREGKESGNPYLLMAISDAKPKKDSSSPF